MRRKRGYLLLVCWEDLVCPRFGWVLVFGEWLPQPLASTKSHKQAICRLPLWRYICIPSVRTLVCFFYFQLDVAVPEDSVAVLFLRGMPDTQFVLFSYGYATVNSSSCNPAPWHFNERKDGGGLSCSMHAPTYCGGFQIILHHLEPAP